MKIVDQNCMTNVKMRLYDVKTIQLDKRSEEHTDIPYLYENFHPQMRCMLKIKRNEERKMYESPEKFSNNKYRQFYYYIIAVR